MRCKSCNYRLWNLSSRLCPECGTSFAPSEFDFTPYSVRFLCPHCEQDYYGGSASGHLEPSEFDCSGCGNRIAMDEMVLFPTEGVEEEQTGVEVAPWLEREKRGMPRAWLSTVGMAMVAPGRLIRGLPGETDCESGWGFGLLTTTLTLLTACLPIVFLVNLGGGIAAAIGMTLIGLLITVIAGALASGIFITIWAAVAHGILRATGHVPGKLGGTAQAICYSSGAGVLIGIPCIGIYFGWIWPVISAVIMVKEAQRVSGWRAAAAVLTLPFTILFGLVVAYGLLIAFTVAGVAPFTVGDGGLEETRTVVKALTAYADDHGGTGPPHAIVLVTDVDLMEVDLVSSDSYSWLDGIPVGGTNLEDFESLPDAQRTTFAQAAAAALPEDVIAHRFGDFVFTYHGVADLGVAPPELWVVVCTFDPDSNVQPPGSAMLWVGLADGNIRPVPLRTMPEELARQNELRATLNLPPLPDVTTVRHGQPARGK